MIEVSNLSIKYKKQNSILENVNLKIYEGDRIAIIGPNGSGKTSFVESIIGLNKNYKGEIKIGSEIKNSIRNIFQEVDYDRELSLKFLYENYSRIAGLKKEEINMNVFEKYNLSHLSNKKYSSLSGGEKQKFKLLMAIELKPKCLIIDEISTALDSQWKIQIVKIVKKFLEENPKTILIIISHEEKEIKELSNKAFLIKNKNFIRIPEIDNYFREMEKEGGYI